MGTLRQDVQMPHSYATPTPTPTPAPTPQVQPADQDFGSNSARAASMTAPEPTLRRGDRGARVKALQDAWVGSGFMTPAQRDTGPGVFGPLTQRATRAFQAARGLSADGIYGPDTANALGSSPTQTAPSTTPETTEELDRGDTGQAVMELQSALVDLGYMTASIMATGPGTFGPRTQAALLAFQAAAGLRTDGIFGAVTAEALERALSAGARHAPAADEQSPAFGGALPQPTLERNNSGGEVKALQEALVALGHMTANDLATGPGVFGPRTQSALIAFQSASGLRADGIYGLDTAEKMASKLGVAAPTTTRRQDRGFDRSAYDDQRDAVIAAAESHLGAPYSWGADGPSMFDCSGFVLYVLRNDTRLVNWGDDTAAGISGRLESTGSPQKGDVVFYRGSNGITHTEFYISGTRTIGASGGGSQTRGNDPNAKVQYGDYTRDSRRKSFGNIENLLAANS